MANVPFPYNASHNAAFYAVGSCRNMGVALINLKNDGMAKVEIQLIDVL